MLIIMITILVMADDRRSAEFVFTHYDATASGWPGGWAWFVGLLQAAYTLTGYGMVASSKFHLLRSIILNNSL